MTESFSTSSSRIASLSASLQARARPRPGGRGQRATPRGVCHGGELPWALPEWALLRGLPWWPSTMGSAGVGITPASMAWGWSAHATPHSDGGVGNPHGWGRIPLRSPQSWARRVAAPSSATSDGRAAAPPRRGRCFVVDPAASQSLLYCDAAGREHGQVLPFFQGRRRWPIYPGILSGGYLGRAKGTAIWPNSLARG